MITNITPWPWEWFTSQKDGTRLQDKTKTQMRFLVGSNGQGFAHTVGLNPVEDSANAALIAAAPEMYDVIEQLVKRGSTLDDCASESGTWKSGDLTMLIVAAELALKKARGE